MVKQFGAMVELAAGSGGVFEVTVDNSLLFSKRRRGRFPKQGEIAALIGRLEG